ncbi:MAG: hypothetical protein ACFFCS_03860, partial [Candidatus Hodarchaeota archaeon]
MKTSKRKIFLELVMVGAFLLAITSNVAAIQTSQATYDEDLVMTPGRVFNYTYSFTNDVGTDSAAYHPTVEIYADVSYNITEELNATHVTIIETIDNIIIKYNYPLEITQPFVGLYNQSVNLISFLKDMVNETYGDSEAPSDFFTLNTSNTQNIPITNNLIFTGIGPFVNNLTYDKGSNNATPVGEVINRFIVSSNISGSGINYSGTGMNYSHKDKILRFGMFYTPMAFSGQDGTFWLDMRMGDMAEVDNYGLWAEYGIGYSMHFHENETYTFAYDHGDDGILRWGSKFEIYYPKIGTNEKVKIDSETGLIFEYTSQPTRYGYKVDPDDPASPYYGDIKPHKIRF